MKASSLGGSTVRPLLSLSLAAALLSGCATATVLGRPKAKDLDDIRAGTSRGLVLAELGAPASTRIVNGQIVDVFAFDKGVSAGWKAGRAIFHLAADVFTFGLWEVVAWPSESVAKGVNTKMEISYDKDEKVSSISYLKK